MLSGADEVDHGMPAILVLSPIITLLAGAGLLRLLYARGYRNSWIAALAVCIIAWVGLLLLGLTPPTSFDLSLDSGASSLQFDYDFALDDLGWEMGLTTLTVLLAHLFLEISQAPEMRATEQPFLMILGAIGVLSMLSGSLLSTVLTWTAFDLAQLLYYSRNQDHGSVAIWPRQAISLILLRAGLLMGAVALGGGTDADGGGFSALGSPIARLLFLGAILSRVFGPAPSSIGKSGNNHHSWGLEFGAIISIGLALAPFSRALRVIRLGPPLGLIGWTGLLGLMIGGIGFALVKDLAQGGDYFSVGLIGLGISLGSFGGEGAWSPVHAGVLGMAVMTIARGSRPFEDWESKLLWFSGAVFAGLPPFVGMVSAAALGEAWQGGGDLLAGALALLGHGALLSGVLRRTRKAKTEWPASEELSRVFYGIGLGLPLLPLLGFGLQNLGRISVSGLGTAAGVFLIGLGIADLSLRADAFKYAQDLADVGLGGWKALKSGMGNVFNTVKVGVLAIVDVLEGEGAVIWLFVLLLFISLLMRAMPA